MVKGEAQGNDGSDFKDNESDILQSLPHQLQEGLGLLGGDEVLPVRFMTVLQIKGVSRKTCRHQNKINANRGSLQRSAAEATTQKHWCTKRNKMKFKNAFFPN